MPKPQELYVPSRDTWHIYVEYLRSSLTHQIDSCIASEVLVTGVGPYRVHERPKVVDLGIVFAAYTHKFNINKNTQYYPNTTLH